MRKIALGTAQFGMAYGINNVAGKVPEKEAFTILSYCLQNGIDCIDTASAYGDSEEMIGRFIGSAGAAPQVISKALMAGSEDVGALIDRSLTRLRLKRLYGYLIHSFNEYLHMPRLWGGFLKAKAEGKIEKTGFSLNYVCELEQLIDGNVSFDMVQVPYNIFDQRFARLFPRLKAKGVEIHVRSIFLQGLLFKDPGVLRGRFVYIKDKLLCLDALSRETRLSKEELCLSFVAANPYIDRIVVGVDNHDQLIRDKEALDRIVIDSDLYGKLLLLHETDEDILVPARWGQNPQMN